MELNFKDAHPDNIWQYAQNHPELVVEDLTTEYPGIDPEIVRKSLMARGVNKWLKVRRDLIAHKKQIKHRIKALNNKIPELKLKCTAGYCTPRQVEDGVKTAYDLAQYYQASIEYIRVKDQLKELAAERATLKKLCMTERWQVWQGKSLKDMNTIKASD